MSSIGIKKISKYCEENLELINDYKIDYDYSYYNNKCHLNSLSSVLKDLSNRTLVYCISIRNGFVMAHFMYYDAVEDLYIDNTLGNDVHTYDNYIVDIKSFKDGDFLNPNNELMWLKRYIKNIAFGRYNPLRYIISDDKY